MTSKKEKIEIPDELKDQMPDVALEYEYREITGGKDTIAIHIHQADAQEPHRVSRFVVTDEDERECAYRQTQGRSSPFEMAVLGLGIKGWTCTNYTPQDERTRKQRRDTRLSHLESMSTVAANIAEDYDDDPVLQEALYEASAATMTAWSLLHYRAEYGKSFSTELDNGTKTAIMSLVYRFGTPEPSKTRTIQSTLRALEPYLNDGDVDE